jgi:hypothetical protein
MSTSARSGASRTCRAPSRAESSDARAPDDPEAPILLERISDSVPVQPDRHENEDLDFRPQQLVQ